MHLSVYNNSMHRLSVNLITLLSVMTLTVLMTACSAPTRLKLDNNITAVEDIYNDAYFGEPIPITPLDEVFALTTAQEDQFKKLFHSPEYRDLSDSHRVFKYLQGQLPHFSFHSKTLIATDALALNSGNCMSLAILTKALTQLTHSGISYELARTPPVFQREGDFELSSQHIRAEIYTKNTNKTKQFVRPNNKVKIDYFSTLGSRTLRKVKKKEFHSLYYSNIAAEAMIESEFNLAYWNLKQALKIEQESLIAINMLGVLYQRLGQSEEAEKAYLFGLSLGGNQLELMNNYHQLLVSSDRRAEARVIASAIDQYDDPDPFQWLDLADKEFKLGHYLKAITFYKKAAEKADYLHQPYAGLAKANFMLGRPASAIKAIEKALDNSHNQQITSIYQAKYKYFKSHNKVN